MRLEAGKCYRTRDGQKALVIGLHPYRQSGAFVGCLERDVQILSWQEDGHYLSDGSSFKADLVSEWQEPKMAWVNIYPLADNGYGYTLNASVWPSREKAARWRTPGCIACVQITYTPGEGLE